MSDMIQRAAEVPFELGGQRLDQIAAQLFPEHSRSRLAGWIKDGRLTVDGAVLRPRDIVHSGAQLVLEAEQEAQGEWLAQDIELEIVYEDEHILVIDKPAGLVVHPAAGHQDGTLLNALLYHVPDIANVPRAGIVHRLDKDTTGLMVVAKDAGGPHQAGGATAGTVGQPHLRGDRDRRDHLRRHHRCADRTAWRAAAEDGGGRRRQGGGQPLPRAGTLPCAHPYPGQAGDRAYPPDPRAHEPYRLSPGRRSGLRWALQDSPVASQTLVQTLREFPRQALHARFLELDHPATGVRMKWESPLPEDFLWLLSLLRQDREAFVG
ncbi:pseudouridine synthase [Pseudomonas aeruginosa]|nr:pseudouridine synthase [Pseudomonas aeruginosa]